LSGRAKPIKQAAINRVPLALAKNAMANTLNAKCGDPNVTKQSEITLDNLTSALKTIYGQETEAVLLIFLHWAKNNLGLHPVWLTPA
jgi:hypothetical protein